ncbi:MAG: class I SAM-dependent methyltransferase [Acidobacteriota bacterium]|nr:class I SAM-dependent methyltransferase [Acidobacteriota bacterium]
MRSSPAAVLKEQFGTRCGLSHERIVEEFCSLLQGEVSFRKDRGLDVVSLKSYYGNLLDAEGRPIPTGVFGYGRRLDPVIHELIRSEPPLEILDAGSGYGTESLFFSLFGHNVTGIELVPERTALALSRIPYFASVCRFPLRVRFRNANILRFLEKSEPFSLIWAMEAVSHIYPEEKFLRLAYEKLRPGGKLIISDPNNLNPLAWLRSVRIRGSVRPSTHTRFHDPETGEPVDYGQELTFTVFSIARRLRAAGFRIREAEMSGFMGSSFLPSVWLSGGNAFRFLQAWQNAASRLPGLRRLGSIFTVVAVKDE